MNQTPEHLNEEFAFTWPGKRQAIESCLSPSHLALQPCPEKSDSWDTTSNYFFEGNNLEVLKLLPSDCKPVSAVFIDPPYNTGHRFFFQDDFRVRKRQGRNTAGTDNAHIRCHAAWCSMIYPRLKLAYDLLSPEGALFIFLNDRELGYLRLICDEICGPDNFITTIVWQTKGEAKGIPPRSMCIKNHEYIIVYAKSKRFRFLGERRRLEDGFANPDNDPRGPWKRQYLQRFGQGFPTRQLRNPANGMVFSFETPYAEEKMQRWLEEGVIMFPDDLRKYPARKEYFHDYPNPYKPILTDWGLYSTKTNSEKLKALLKQTKCFDYPKPTELVQRLVQQSCPPQGTVLDIFAGSSTTAHATMLQNAADGGQRRFIMIQIPEVFAPDSAPYRLGYRNLCDMSVARIRQAARQINSDQPIDSGFKYFRTAEKSE